MRGRSERRVMGGIAHVSVLFAVLLGVSVFSMVASGARKPDARHLKVAERLAKTKVVTQKICMTCHTIGKSGGTVGPILNQIANRRTPEWLRRWLKDPHSIKPNTKMPNFQLTDAEVDKLLSYMKDMRRDIDGSKILAAESDPVKSGAALFEAYDCYACHRLGARGRFVGPDLTWIGVRKSEDWETVWLRDPPAYKPSTFMPDFNLSEAEITALVAFLHSLQGQQNDASRKWEARSAMARPRERGRLVAQRLACWSCHGENLSEGARNPNAAPDGVVPSVQSAHATLGEAKLKERILTGSAPHRKDPTGLAPPFTCPPWKDALNESELADLIAYLKSLAPKEEKPVR